jgi:hypothetical protein
MARWRRRLLLVAIAAAIVVFRERKLARNERALHG